MPADIANRWCQWALIRQAVIRLPSQPDQWNAVVVQRRWMPTSPHRALLALTVVLAAWSTVSAQPSLEISLKNGTPAEAQTRDQLRRLLATYDLSPWIYTKTVVIDARAVPFSHPTLTLHTRHLKDDDLLLSTFLHEQLHWFFAERQPATDLAMADLRAIFPTVPSGGREGGRDEPSSYLHLLVCYLEQQATRSVLGDLETRQVMEFWATDHYTWVYRTVLDRGDEIRKVLSARRLLPAP